MCIVLFLQKVLYQLPARAYCISASLPPIQAHGNAVSAIAMGYQAGPSFMGIVASAPAEPTTKPTPPKIKAWRMGLRGASRAAM